MNWSLRRMLLLATLLGGLALGATAQGPPAAKKAEPLKVGPEKPVEPGKSKDVGKPKLPGGAIVIPAEDIEKALARWPKMYLIRPDKYQEMLDLIANLKRQVKKDRATAHSCVLTGRLEGDYVALRAEFQFATEGPRATVVLGLQKAQLTEKGELDGKTALMDFADDEGFTARVDEPGDHRLILHVRVPVVSKRPAGGTGVDRGFDLGLPGIPITTLTLELPDRVKEVRWNDALEKNRTQGKWFFALGKNKALNVAWREPASQPGGVPHLFVDGKVTVRLSDTHAELSAVLTLEDPRGQTKECRLVLPAPAEQVDVEVQPPAGVPYKLTAPNYVLRFPEPNTERWVVTAFVRVPRPMPGARLAVGPFYVQGAEHQRGTITVLAPAELLRKQRLIYHRFGEVFQRDPPKTPDVDAVFQYWGLPDPARAKTPAARVPLSIEVKSERGPLEASLDQILKLRPSGEGWEIDLTAHVQVKSSYGGDFIELQLPRPRPFGVTPFAAAPGAPFPAVLPWPGLGLVRGPLAAWAVPLEFQLDDGGASSAPLAPDAQGRCRVPLPRSQGKGFTLAFTGKYAVAGPARRVRVGLPRVLGLTEQGSKITVQTEESSELLVGPRGLEEPVPDKHRYQLATDETPTFVDLAWRRYRPDFRAEAVIDVVLHGRTAQVRERLTFGTPPRAGGRQLLHDGRVQLEVPAAAKGLSLLHGERRTGLLPEHGHVWVIPDGGEAKEVVLEYDLALSGPPATGGAAEARTLTVPAVWPVQATRQSAKVRVWSAAGTRVRPTGADAWQDRGVEAVAGRDALPALVMQGDGALPLVLRLEDTPESGVAALVCDRALIRAELGEDDVLSCRARYHVMRIGAEAVEVAFPVSVAQCQLQVRLGRHAIAWEAVPAAHNVARIPLKGAIDGQPFILDLEYKLPAATQEGRLFGLSTLYPPAFRATVVVDRLRWQVILPAPALAVPLSSGARADYRWSLDRWLLCPTPAVASADLEAWLGNPDAVDTVPVSLSFWPAGQEPQRVFHQPRPVWVLLCSGGLVALFLVLYFLPLRRGGLALALGLLGLGTLALGLTWPALMPGLFYAVQPGLAVVALLLLAVWLLQERYRRQLVFIPGFTRLKAGSSLVRTRTSKASQRPRDASTIDAPAPMDALGTSSSNAKK